MTKKYFLAVDDEQDLKFLFDHFFGKYISDQQLEVIFFDSADKCLQELKDIHGDVVVLTDINMPGMSGIELLRKIREQNYNAKVLLTSAYDESNYRKEMIDYDASGYISKPVDFNHLKNSVLDLLNIEQ